MVRVGIGYDVHRLVPDRPLILGGVTVSHDRGLAGHSDADVLAHAVADALLGAAALGDIGKHFPDTDPAYEGADSLDLLRRVAELIRAEGFEINNVDATVALQRPRLRELIDSMRVKLASALTVTLDQVSVKATTTERLGFVGTEEGAAAYAICAITRI